MEGKARHLSLAQVSFTLVNFVYYLFSHQHDDKQNLPECELKICLCHVFIEREETLYKHGTARDVVRLRILSTKLFSIKRVVVFDDEYIG